MGTANIPDIAILSPEERSCVAEYPSLGGGIVLCLCRKAQLEDRDAAVLVFADKGAATAWASLRARKLSREGEDIYWNTPGENLRPLPDERLKDPLKSYRVSALNRMLEW